MEIHHCFNPSILIGLRSIDKVLLVPYHSVGQTGLNTILAKYPQIRDFHNNPPYAAAVFHFNAFIAKSINFTFVSEYDVKPNCSSDILGGIPKLHNMVRGHQLHEFFDVNLNRTSEAVQRYTQPFSFAYCDIPRRELDTLSPLIIFQNTADNLVWCCLITSIILISLIIKRRSRQIKSSTVLITLSALISGGVSISSKSMQRSWLLMAWMYVCLTFVTYFSGNLTSQVIRPSPEFRFSNLKDLLTNNYSLVVNPIAMRFMKRQVETIGLVHQSGIVKALTSTSVVTEDENIPQILITKPKTATMFIWSHAFKTISRAQEFQKVSGMLQKHCYVGKELFFDESLFILVTPTRIQNLRRALRVIMEQGIFHIWIQEYVGMSGSPRVQDRSRILSGTNFREDTQLPTKLSMSEGKIKNVFVLWVSCLIICGVGFIIEKVSNEMSRFS